jgi:hypothetical protein
MEQEEIEPVEWAGMEKPFIYSLGIFFLEFMLDGVSYNSERRKEIPLIGTFFPLSLLSSCSNILPHESNTPWRIYAQILSSFLDNFL